LEIPQSNKNDIVRKARNTNANINALKREAINIQTKRQSDGIENAKQRLIARLTPLELSQTNRNSIMKKFELGNRNVNKLVEEAKQLKSLRNKEALNTKRKEYSSFLNTLKNLTPEDKRKLLNNGNFNQNRALQLAKNRATQAKMVQKNNFSTFLNQIGLIDQDKINMLKLFDSNTLTINALKKKATNLKNTRISEKKLENRNALKKNLENATNLENTIKVDIMKRFEAGEANLTTLRAEITELIQGIRKNRLTNKKKKIIKNVQNSILSQVNKNAFIRKLDDPNLNINTLRGELNTMIEKAVESQRAKNRNELEQYMISKKMTNTIQSAILSKFNANVRISLNALKQEANTLLKQRLVAQRAENVAKLNAYGRELGLNNATITTLTSKLNSESLNSLKAEADRIAKEKANVKNEELNKYMTNIGLNNNNKRNVLNQKLPLNDAKRFANNLLQKKIAEKRNKNKAALSIILNSLKIANNDRSQFFNNLNKGVDVKIIEQNAINFVKKKNAMTRGYQKQDLLDHLSMLKLNNAEQQQFINAFNDNTNNLNTIKKRASNFAKKSANNKRAAERQDLYQYINNINLNVEDRNLIMKQFDKTNTNLATMKEKANSLKKIKESKKLIADRSELEKYMRKTLKLSQTNVNTILSKFNAGEGTILSLKTNAEELSAQRKDEKRLANRNELLTYFSQIGLSEENGKSVLNKFNGETIGLKSARKEAATLVKTLITQKRAQNRADLVEFMNTLQNLNNVGKKRILKEYDSETANLNTLKNRASQINAATRNKAEQRRDLYQYINGLGINATPFMNKFDSGKGTLNSLKANADKAKKELNARAIDKKKDDLRAFMKNTRISNANKNSFLNRVNLNTNLNTIKKEVRMLNQRIENKDQKVAGMKTELRVFLNTLNNVTPQNKQKLIAKVVNNSTNINQLKNEGRALNKAAKNKRAEAQRLNEEEEARKIAEAKLKDEARLESHLKGLKDLTANRVEYYKRELAAEKATLATLMAQSKEEDKKQKSEKAAFYSYIRNTKIPESKKKNYIAQVKAPRSDIVAIKKIVNANIEAIKREEVRFAEEQEAIKIKKEEEAKKKLEQNLQKLSSELQKLTNLTNENRTKYMNSLKARPSTFNMVLKQAQNKNAGTKRLKAQAEEERKKQEERERQKKEEERKARNKQTKNLAESLQSLSTLTRENRKKFMARLPQNNPQLILKNAVNLNDERKAEAKAEENARIAEERKKQAAEEAKRKKEQNMKNVSTELQKLTNLTKNNRGTYIKKLNTMGKNTVIAEAKSENVRRKREKEKKRQAEEESIKKRRQAEEEGKKKAEEERKARNVQTKKVATSLQGLQYLKRENRKKFMNRLPQNGANKVIANATKLDQERKEDEASTRRGIEWKLKKIGVSGKELQGLLKRWNDAKDKTIFDEARKMVAKKKDPLLARIKRNVPASNNFSQARMKWTAAIKEATDDASLQKIERLLDTKLKLKAKTEAEVKSLPPREQARYLKNFMAYKNDVSQRTQELNKLAKTKRDAKDTATRETAGKLQSLNKLERDNRKRFMNRVAKGENSKVVLRNAEKLQRNRTAAARLEAERKAREQKQAQERKEREEKERKQREYEKQKQTKLRANTAKMLQGMSGLERSNRKEFMARLNRGNDPARVISNARARNQKARSRPKTGPQPRPAQQPKGRVAGKTKKMKAKNRARRPTAKPSYGSKRRRR
jgi:hypothetical protein